MTTLYLSVLVMLLFFILLVWALGRLPIKTVILMTVLAALWPLVIAVVIPIDILYNLWAIEIEGG